MAFDKAGELWATTAGGPLLQLDPLTGADPRQLWHGITIAIAVDPTSGTIYVSTNKGISTFDPVGAHASRSGAATRTCSSTASPSTTRATLWAVTLPDRARWWSSPTASAR